MHMSGSSWKACATVTNRAIRRDSALIVPDDSSNILSHSLVFFRSLFRLRKNRSSKGEQNMLGLHGLRSSLNTDLVHAGYLNSGGMPTSFGLHIMVATFPDSPVPVSAAMEFLEHTGDWDDWWCKEFFSDTFPIQDTDFTSQQAIIPTEPIFSDSFVTEEIDIASQQALIPTGPLVPEEQRYESVTSSEEIKR